MKLQLVLLIMSTLFISAVANAQKTKFGLQAGATMSNARVEAGSESESSDSKFGFTLGFMLDKQISKSFYFQPSLNWTQKGFEESDGSEKMTETLNYLELPLNFLYRQAPDKGFFVGLGPTIAMGLSGKIKMGDEEADINFGSNSDDDYRLMEYGGNVLAGYLFQNKLQIAVNYNFGLSNVFPENDFDFSMKNNYWGLRIGYFFK